MHQKIIAIEDLRFEGKNITCQLQIINEMVIFCDMRRVSEYYNAIYIAFIDNAKIRTGAGQNHNKYTNVEG